MKTKLRMGADPFPPYQYYGPDGVLRGSDYETVKKAGEAAGFEMDFLLEDWGLVEAKLMAGELDGAFQVQKTPARAEKLHFSKLLRTAATEVITANAGLPLDAFGQIAQQGLTLGVLAGYAYGEEVDSLPQSCKKVYEGQEALLSAIAKREVDLGIFDAGVKAHLIEKLSLSGIYAIEALTFQRPLYVVFQNEDVCRRFDEQLP